MSNKTAQGRTLKTSEEGMKALSHCPFVPGITMWPSAGDMFLRGGRSVARGDNAMLESFDRGWPLDTRY